MVFAAGLTLLAQVGSAQSISGQELQILARSASFIRLELPLEARVAIVYLRGSDNSRQDAEAIARLFGDGLQSGNRVFRPRIVPSDELNAESYSLYIVTPDANGVEFQQAYRAAHALCVTSDYAAVQGGLCVMTIRPVPRVEILVNHPAADAAGIEFAAAFGMMAREF